MSEQIYPNRSANRENLEVQDEGRGGSAVHGAT